MGCTPTKCTPMRRTSVRYIPLREAYREWHSHKRYAPAKDARPRDACLRGMVRSPYWINGKAGSGKVDPYEVHLLQSMYAAGFT
jgi:hypothetical protein